MNTTSNDINVRRTTIRDADAVQNLLEQLGYTATMEETAERIRKVARSRRAFLAVATSGDATVGLVAAVVAPYFPNGTDICRITALVVDQDRRGGGIGEALVDSATAFARNAACASVEVTTANARARTHQFYEKMGFARTSVRFFRAL